MLRLLPTSPRPAARKLRRLCRRLVRYGVLAVCAVVVVYAVVLEPYQIPTGSMAPALFGHHRVCACPRCGQQVIVGRATEEIEGSSAAPRYSKAFCPNCGMLPIPVREGKEVQGHRILVNKTAFLVRAPRRWEIIVFRLLGMHYIKRLLGLPGEEILVQDGDVYADGELLRKSLEEVRALRMRVFAQEHVPEGGDWRCRWETTSGRASKHLAAKPWEVVVDGRATPQTLTYANNLLETGKCEPLRDEYAYNAGLHADSECVHDFMIETELEVQAGRGSVALRLCDGQDWVEVLLPVNEERKAEAFCWPMQSPASMQKLGEASKLSKLRAGRRYRVELAFIDRRLSLAVDGESWLSLDLPVPGRREGVARPFQVHADGVRANLHRFCLYRDVHYGQQGKNGVRGKSVQLGVDQYFVLGDNSPNSQDSRFWPEEGRIPGRCLVGSAWLVYGSSPVRRLP